DWREAARTSRRDGVEAHPHRHLGRRHLGDPVLREERLPAAAAPGDRPAPAQVLEDPRAADRDLGRARELRPEIVSAAPGGAGAVAEVRQTATARDRCHVSGALAGTKVWSLDACLASFEDLRFVSPDGVALVVLQTAPDAEQATVGAVFRKGARIATLTP